MARPGHAHPPSLASATTKPVHVHFKRGTGAVDDLGPIRVPCIPTLLCHLRRSGRASCSSVAARDNTTPAGPFPQVNGLLDLRPRISTWKFGCVVSPTGLFSGVQGCHRFVEHPWRHR